MQTDRLYMPFGVSKFDNKWSGISDYSINCYVDNQFDLFCDSMDSKVIELLKDHTTSEFTPSLRANKTFPKLFKLKLPRDSMGNFNVVGFDTDTNKILITEDNVEEVFCKGREFKGLVQCEKIIDYAGKSRVSWMLTQMKYIEKGDDLEISEPEGYDASSTTTAGAYTQFMLD